jgi:dUTP pyrophosphatase
MLLSKRIEIKLFDQECMPVVLDVGAWIDLKTRLDVQIYPGEFSLIPLGVAMRLPEGYEAHVIPRSGTYKKYGIIQANSFGLIDPSYCGDGDEWMFPAINLRGDVVRIPRGSRLCQFRIVEVQGRVVFDFVESLGSANRGGFGSTGE